MNTPNLSFFGDVIYKGEGFLSYEARFDGGVSVMSIPTEEGRYPIYAEITCSSLPDTSPDLRGKAITQKIYSDVKNIVTSDALRAIEIAKSNPAWDKRGLVIRGTGVDALLVMTLAEQIDGVSFIEILSPSFCDSDCDATQFKRALTYPVYICAEKEHADYATSLYNAFCGIKALDLIEGEKTLRLRHNPKNPSGEFKTGKYRHYKGGEYEVVGIAHDSETLEDIVVYRSLKDKELWVRPKWMFEEYANVRGIATKRFEYID